MRPDYPEVFSIINSFCTEDKKTISAEKVLYSLYTNRGSPELCREIVDFLCKCADEKRVFNDIEFFLPQLAHLIIHVEADWKQQTLERLAVVISQTSMHAALNLSFAFIAAMEDYQVCCLFVLLLL